VGVLALYECEDMVCQVLTSCQKVDGS
jgi:hypothetical protein